MGPRVMLIDPSDGSSLEGRTRKPVNPNLGLAYIASFLQRECNAHVKVVEMHAYRLSIRQVYEMVADFCPDVLGTTAKTFNVLSAYEVAKLTKKVSEEKQKEIITVIGGAHATALSQLTLEECGSLDAVVRGEGELTMKEIVTRFCAGNSGEDLFAGVKGLTYRTRTGEIVHNNDQVLIADLDTLPFPDYSLYDMAAYGMKYNHVRHRFATEFPVLASRGCPYHCTFCMPLLTRTHRQRSVQNVIEEIQLLVQRHKCSWVYFEDSTFCVNKKWFKSFCEQLMHWGLHRKVSWGFESRAELLQNEDIFRQAKEAGCIYVYFGIESASQTVLHHAQKGITKDHVLTAVECAKRAGISQVAGSLVFGLPYETRESVEETLRFMRELDLGLVNLNLLSVYPGTELWDMVERGEGGIKWLPGMRYNWMSYNRATCQTLVNDLTERDLLQVLARARRELLRGFWREGAVEFLLRLVAYVGYYLRKDPKQLAKYLKEYLMN